MKTLVFIFGMIAAIIGGFDAFLTTFTFAKYNPHSVIALWAQWALDVLSLTPRGIGVPMAFVVIGMILMLISVSFQNSRQHEKTKKE